MTRVTCRRCWVRGRGLGSRRSVSSCRLGCRGTTTWGGGGQEGPREEAKEVEEEEEEAGEEGRRLGSLLINGRPQQEEGVGVGVGGAGAGVSIQHGILAARPASCTRARTQTHALRLPVLAEGRGRGGGKGQVWLGRRGGDGRHHIHCHIPCQSLFSRAASSPPVGRGGRLSPRRPRIAASCTPGNLPSLALAGFSQSLAVCHSIFSFHFIIMYFLSFWSRKNHFSPSNSL